MGKTVENKETIVEKRCFVMMPFSSQDGYEPGHFDDVYRDLISPAIIQAGYEPFRVDEDKDSGLIDIKIIRSITESDMALCDLSERNANVLYELGIRHSFEKPVVLIQDNNTERIFDVSSVKTISYDSRLVYKDVIKTQKEIKEAILATANNPADNSIIKLAHIYKATYENADSETDKSSFIMKEMLWKLDQISDRMDTIEAEVLMESEKPPIKPRRLLPLWTMEIKTKKPLSSETVMKVAEKYQALGCDIFSIRTRENTVLIESRDDMNDNPLFYQLGDELGTFICIRKV